MNNRSIGLAGLASLFLYGCSGGGGGNSGSIDNTTTGPMRLIEVSTGNGLILPLQIFPPDAQGAPDTSRPPVQITSRDVLTANLRPTNPVLAPVQWPSRAILSTQRAGNHFALVRFNQGILVESVLSDAAVNPGLTNLTGAIEVVGIDLVTGQETPIAGRGFVQGRTYGSIDPMDSSKRLLESWVEPNGTGIADAPAIGSGNPGLGFPGTQSAVPGIERLLSNTSFVFVADSDQNLETHETFPSGVQIHVRFTEDVMSFRGRNLSTPGIAATRVSPTVNPSPDIVPLALRLEADLSTPLSTPSNGAIDVDPATIIELSFTKNVQITTLGNYEDGTPPNLSSGAFVEYGTIFNRVRVPFSVAPRSVFDFTHMQLRPIVSFIPGNPNNMDLCSAFSNITVTLPLDEATGLGSMAAPIAVPHRIDFSVGEGPALINNPVLPDAIYVGRTNALSVLDLNGFGQGPGNPTYDPGQPIKKGNSNFPNNRNFILNGSSLSPPLAQGQCTVDGGSEGAFTLAKDSALNDRLLSAPILESVVDITLGHSLDATFNNGAPFGCQSGVSANTCASSIVQLVSVVTGAGGTYIPFETTNFIHESYDGGENMVSWAPHPNPPALIFPPACFSPVIGAAEPTSVDTFGINGISNSLTPGALPQGNPAAGLIPDGLLANLQNGFFVGPSLPDANIARCNTFMMRQQIGQFMYVIDRTRSEIVVLNSNRFTVLDRIGMPDPTSFAMSPDLDILAVTNQSANQVFFLDTNPASSSFHQLVGAANVGEGPTGIAWTPGNEDILVCNTGDSTLSIISTFTFTERKRISNQLRNPIEVAITGRQVGYARQRGVYFAYILNADGTIAVFESGPDGVAGIGFDDTIGTLPFQFNNPKTIQPDASSLFSQIWVVHEGQLGPGDGTPTGNVGGAVTLVRISAGAMGAQSLATGGFGNANARDLQWEVAVSIGSDQLSGIPVDIAFDNMVSRSATANFRSPFSSRTSVRANGKAIVRQVPGLFNALASASDYEYIFLAVPNSNQGSGGAIDVIQRSGNARVDTDLFVPGVQSIPASGVTLLADFFRQ